MKKGTSSDSAVISFLRLGDGGMVGDGGMTATSLVMRSGWRWGMVGDGGMTATSLVMHYYRYAAVVGTFG